MSAPVYDIVMLVLNDVSYDGRVRREAAALSAAGWRVLVIGTQRSYGTLPDEEMIQGFTLRRVRYGRFGANKRRPWCWFRHGLQAVQIIRTLIKTPTSAFHAHDLPPLMLIMLARLVGQRSARVVYDAHELFFFQPPDPFAKKSRKHDLLRPLLASLEKFLARRADAVVTVTDTVSRTLALWYGLPRPTSVYNAIDPVLDNERCSIDLRTLVGAGRRCIIHTGTITNRGRCLTELIHAVSLLPDDVTLVFMGPDEESEKLGQVAAKLGIAERVFFLPPVEPEHVSAAIRGADVAAVVSRPDSWDVEATLPNKLFEAVSAGIPVVASHVFTLTRMVRQYHLGEVCDPLDPQSVAEALRRVLSADGQAHFRAGTKAAQERLNWQCEAAKLCAVYKGLLP